MGWTFSLVMILLVAKFDVLPSVHVCSEPRVIEETERLSSEFSGIFPACVTTRSMARSLNNGKEVKPQEVNDSFKLARTFFSKH